jgi:hypothetical protein
VTAPAQDDHGSSDAPRLIEDGTDGRFVDDRNVRIPPPLRQSAAGIRGDAHATAIERGTCPLRRLGGRVRSASHDAMHLRFARPRKRGGRRHGRPRAWRAVSRHQHPESLLSRHVVLHGNHARGLRLCELHRGRFASRRRPTNGR